MYFLKYLLFFTSVILASSESDESVQECARYSPKEIQETFFTPVLEQRIKLVRTVVKEIYTNLEEMKGKVPNLNENLQKLSDEPMAEFPSDPIDLIEQELDMILRSHDRNWNRIWDTMGDILEPSRCPRAPKTLSDLKDNIGELTSTYRTSLDHLESSLKESLAEVSSIMKPLILVMDNILKAAGQLPKLVDNLQGQIMLELIKVKQDRKEPENPDIFGELISMSEALMNEFISTGRRLSLEDFWKSQISRIKKPELIDETTDAWKQEKVGLGVYLLNSIMDLKNAKSPDMVEIMKKFQT